VTQGSFGNLEFARYFCYFFSIIINFGFDVTITRKITLRKSEFDYVNNIVCQTFYSKTILLFISALFYFIIINTVPSLQDIIFLLTVTFSINIGFVLFPVWFFQGIEELSQISLINFLIKIIIALLTVILIKKNSDYWIFNYLQSMSFIILGLVSLFFLKIKYKLKIFKVDFSVIKEIMKEGLPIFMSTILVTFISMMFFVFLKLYSNQVELGAFSTSHKIVASLQALILLPFSQAFFPMITRYAKQDIKLFKKNINLSAFIMFVITGLIGLFLILFSDLFIKILFGDKYLYASQSLKVLAFLPMLMLLNNVFAYQGLLSLKKDKIFMNIHFFGSFFSVLICFLFKNHLNAYLASKIRVGVEFTLLVLTLYFYLKTLNKETLKFNSAKQNDF
jgi:PST family polysaccharide transporter